MAVRFESYNFVEKVLFVPDLKLLAEAFRKKLSENFCETQVDVVDCPDLTKEPFYLNSEGIGGSPSLISCGSVHNFVPKLKLERIFNIKKFPVLAGLKSASFIGTGMYHCQQSNYLPETTINASVSEGELETNKTVGLFMDKLSNKHVLRSAPEQLSEFPCLVDLLMSKGERSKVLRVQCSKRTGKLSFPSVLRNGLTSCFPDKLIGLGGVFLIKQGMAKCHVNHLSVNDQYKETDSFEEFFKDGCTFINMSAPLVAVGEIISQDPGLELRLEHFHSYSVHGDGGHYHYDTTPESVEYLGYFSIAESLYRIDYPEKFVQNHT